MDGFVRLAIKEYVVWIQDGQCLRIMDDQWINNNRWLFRKWHDTGAKEKRAHVEKYRMRGLNSRPLACEASVITTTPTRPVTFPQRTVFHNKERMIILPTSPPSTRYTTCSCRGAIWTHCPWCVHWSGTWAFSFTDTYWGGSTHTQFDAWSLQWSHPPDRCVAIPGSSHTRPCTIQIHSKSPTVSFFF